MPIYPKDYAIETDQQKMDAIAMVIAVDVGERLHELVPAEHRRFASLNLRQIMRIAAEQLGTVSTETNEKNPAPKSC